MRDGGYFGVESIAHFNGGLFDDAPSLPLTAGDIHAMRLAAGYDWGAVEPSIFGTLFERSLDPSKRSQIGAHYTSREDIMLIVEPVVMAPLRHEWAEVRQKAEKLTQQMQKAVRKKLASGRLLRKGGESAPRRKLDQLLHDFQDRLASICVLDPACGSGNFLYVAIQELLALEKEVIIYAAQPHIGLGLFPRVRPTQLHGLELNPYAAELAQVVIWIGYLQWMRDNGFIEGITHPILEPLQTIECRDAILKWQDEAGDPVPTWRPGANCPGPADWPDGDFIIGNPPFLGGNLIRQGLGDAYVATLFATYDLPNFSDLCCYWHEKACHLLRNHRSVRVGLLATQAIRGGANREVLHRIKRDGDVFMAWSDREWVLEGAHVHVSMVGFDCGAEQHRFLDGRPVPGINADLTAGTDLTTAAELSENRSVQYEADKKGAAFDVNCDLARRLLARPTLTSRSSITVCRPWANGSDITRRFRAQWIVDFGFEMSMEEAARFEGPFEYILQTVAPKYRNKRKRWWLHERPRPAMRRALAPLPRYIASPMLTKHRLFVWLNHDVLPDHQLVVFARSDDYFFGVLHSSIHELWARRMGTQLREAESGFRYTPTTCFETFPLPWPPASEPRPAGSDPRSEPRPAGSDPRSEPRPLASAPRSEPRPSASAPRSEPRPSASAQTPSDHDQSLAPARGSDSLARDTALHQRIGDAARELNEQRERWLNPPEWTEAIANYVDSKDDFSDVPPEARPLIRHSAIMAAAARDPRLKTRTLTNLYNERPTWLRLAHEKLDRAVLAAYAAVDPEGEWSEDWAEVWLDTGAGQPLADDHALAARRQETDQRVLANLLRMNQMRAAAP